MKPFRISLLSAWQCVALATFSCTFAIGVLSVRTGATQSSLLERWKDFVARPSEKTYRSLSRTIPACVASKCNDDAVPREGNNFAEFQKLLRLVENGNHLAMELAFQIRPLYGNDAASSEDLDNSLGLSATPEPTFFLRLVQKYDISQYSFQSLLVQTSEKAIDHLGVAREEWMRRIRSFSKVKDPTLLPLRQQAISYIKYYIKQYSNLPDDAWGK